MRVQSSRLVFLTCYRTKFREFLGEAFIDPSPAYGGTASLSARYSVAPFMSAPPHRSLHDTLRPQGRIAALNVSAISTLTPAGAQETQ